MGKRLRIVTPRKLNWEFTETPIVWCGDDPLFTHFLNTYTLLVPDNEKYYIRALQHCVGDLESPELRRTVHRFCQQESLHGVAHRKYWNRLADEKISYIPFVKAVDIFLYRILEPLQPKPLKLSIVAAIEHINASWAYAFLSGDWLREADPSIRKLFYWHFAEEIEHKAVVDDVLRTLYPYYALRVLGALMAFPIFMFITFAGTAYLLAVDGLLLRATTWKRLLRVRRKSAYLRMMWAEFVRYLRPGFRPWDRDDYYLAEKFLSAATSGAQARRATVNANNSVAAA